MYLGHKNITTSNCIFWQFFVTFLGWLSEPFKGCWWPPTIGDKKVTAWITWFKSWKNNTFSCREWGFQLFIQGHRGFSFSPKNAPSKLGDFSNPRSQSLLWQWKMFHSIKFVLKHHAGWFTGTSVVQDNIVCSRFCFEVLISLPIRTNC